MTSHGELATWEGVLSAGDLEALLERVGVATRIGQRAGDFSLGGSLDGGAAGWPCGRCFNEDLEIRWWPAENGRARNVLILNRLPEGWAAPGGWRSCVQRLAERPDDEVRYLCVGQYDEGPDGSHLWWETRYGRSFAYLDSAPTVSGERRGRVYLHAVTYELEDGRTQHRLVRFEHARPEDAT